MTRIERPRGTHDILPSEQPLWRRVTGEMEGLAALYDSTFLDDPRLANVLPQSVLAWYRTPPARAYW